MTCIRVLAGSFQSQPLVFSHLLEACAAHGLVLDMDHVEVILGAPKGRLSHVLSDADCASIEATRHRHEALVLVFPEALIPGARLFSRTEKLRPIGAFPPLRGRFTS